jgi:hypothetical protein
VPEGVKRSPGKSKFSIPRKEAPPIDGSYLDRLFADFNRQTKELEAGGDAAQATEAEATERTGLAEHEESKALAGTVPEAITGEVAPPAPRLQPVPSPVEEKEFPAPLEAETPVSHPVTPTKTEKESVTRTPALKPTKTPHTFEGQELVEKLVKVHRLSKGEAGVLRAMIRMCEEGGSDICYVKIPSLMAATGLKDRQTQRVLKSLSELQLIERLAEYSNADRRGIKFKVISLHG